MKTLEHKDNIRYELHNARSEKDKISISMNSLVFATKRWKSV